jgi:hypothetical protein
MGIKGFIKDLFKSEPSKVEPVSGVTKTRAKPESRFEHTEELSPVNKEKLKLLIPKAEKIHNEYRELLDELSSFTKSNEVKGAQWKGLLNHDQTFWIRAKRKIDLTPSRIYLYLNKHFR